MPGEFVSEAITPDAGTFDAGAMATGVPGLPGGFRWRGEHHAIVEVLSTWKASEAENHAGGERYFRKQFWKVRTDRGIVATIYAVRHVKRGEHAKRRWWMYVVHRDDRD